MFEKNITHTNRFPIILKWILVAVFLSASSSLYAKVMTKVIPYSVNGIPMTGYYAYDDAIKGKRPGVLVVHEWWGQNAYARKRVRMLAKLGYSAFALDMYGRGKVTEHPSDAKKFMMAVINNMDIARKRYKKGLAILKAQAMTDPKRVAAIGYCFGGGVVLDMARQGVDLKGVVSFHGSLGTKQAAKKGKVKARILVLNGKDDPFTTKKQITAFKKEMKQAKVNYEFINYKGAKHSFTNPRADVLGKKFNLPLQYNAKADKESWAKMQQFFKQIFK